MTNIHALSYDNTAVYPADKIKLQISLIVYACDDKAYLVHVGAEHKPFAGLYPALFEYQKVFYGIGNNLTGKGHGPLQNIVAHFVLTAGNAA